jgi:hypothetical protein
MSHLLNGCSRLDAGESNNIDESGDQRGLYLRRPGNFLSLPGSAKDSDL